MAWNGWTSLRQVQLYTKDMRRSRMADRAAVKLSKGQTQNKSVPLSHLVRKSGTNGDTKI
jgi:hypothetical protein